MQIPVRDKLGYVVNAEDDLAPAPEEVFIHRYVHRELVSAAVDPSREIMIQRYRDTAISYHQTQHPEVISVISSPEAVPCIVTSAVSRR